MKKLSRRNLLRMRNRVIDRPFKGQCIILPYYDGTCCEDSEYYDPETETQYFEEIDCGLWQHSRYGYRRFYKMHEALEHKKNMENKLKNGEIYFL